MNSLQRGQYTLNVKPADLQTIRMDSKVPLELYEARNAVQIARWTGADRYAADTFQKALIGLQNAEGYLRGKGGKKSHWHCGARQLRWRRMPAYHGEEDR